MTEQQAKQILDILAETPEEQRARLLKETLDQVFRDAYREMEGQKNGMNDMLEKFRKIQDERDLRWEKVRPDIPLPSPYKWITDRSDSREDYENWDNLWSGLLPKTMASTAREQRKPEMWWPD